MVTVSPVLGNVLSDSSQKVSVWWVCLSFRIRRDDSMFGLKKTSAARTSHFHSFFFICSFMSLFTLSFIIFFHFLMFPDSAISPPILMSCSSHTEACNELGTTDGVTSH